MHRTLTVLILVALAACSSLPDAADPLSDAPEGRYIPTTPIKAASSYEQALLIWRNAEDLNAWIGTKFEYDMSRAMLLSETQRATYGRLPIYTPEEFFSAPRGVCVDLSRFAVETLRVIDPKAKSAYLLIEFAPVPIEGNTLRLHWLAMYRHQGSFYFFADSKRPGHIAGPYATVNQFIAEYARYRGRDVVAFRELESYERKLRTPASRHDRSFFNNHVPVMTSKQLGYIISEPLSQIPNLKQALEGF